MLVTVCCLALLLSWFVGEIEEDASHNAPGGFLKSGLELEVTDTEGFIVVLVSLLLFCMFTYCSLLTVYEYTVFPT